jgi:hypothetical protein
MAGDDIRNGRQWKVKREEEKLFAHGWRGNTERDWDRRTAASSELRNSWLQLTDRMSI